MKTLKKYFVYIAAFFSIYSSLMCPIYAEEVCFSESDSVDLITLLDASERDLDLLSSCNKLVDELYEELEIREEKIVSLTDDLIKANQQVIKYKKKYRTAKKVAWYTTAAGVIVLLVTVIPAI